MAYRRTVSGRMTVAADLGQAVSRGAQYLDGMSGSLQELVHRAEDPDAKVGTSGADGLAGRRVVAPETGRSDADAST